MLVEVKGMFVTADGTPISPAAPDSLIAIHPDNVLGVYKIGEEVQLALTGSFFVKMTAEMYDYFKYRRKYGNTGSDFVDPYLPYKYVAFQAAKNKEVFN